MSFVDAVLTAGYPDGFPSPEIQRGRVLQLWAEFGDLGATDNEMVASSGISASAVRPRRGELQKAGLIETEATETRDGSQVWRLTAKARAALTPSFSSAEASGLGAVEGAALSSLTGTQRALVRKVRLNLAQLVRTAQRAALDRGSVLEESLSPETDVDDDAVLVPLSCSLRGPSAGSSEAFSIDAALSAAGLTLSLTLAAPADTHDKAEADIRRRTRAQLAVFEEPLRLAVDRLTAAGWSLGTREDGTNIDLDDFEDWFEGAKNNGQAAPHLSKHWTPSELDSLGFGVGGEFRHLAEAFAHVMVTLALHTADPVEALVDGLFWEQHRAEALVDLATRSRQLLFAGPPGTGKTFAARALAHAIAGEGSVRVMQFHPTYAYEDFVEGIRPALRPAGTDGQPSDGTNDTAGSQLGYVMRRGILRDVVQQAEAREDQPVFLVIDEINRANLPRVFGELLFSLEYRGPGNEVVLPYSGDLFTLPENLWIIGTMNTADRSVALMDAAMRRRFKQVRFDVHYGALTAWHGENTTAALGNEAAHRLKRLNDALVDLLDEDRLLGHSYLMRKDLEAVGWATIWAEDFEPVLRDHLLGQLDELPALRKAFVDGPSS